MDEPALAGIPVGCYHQAVVIAVGIDGNADRGEEFDPDPYI
jgi:hypothetical protein